MGILGDISGKKPTDSGAKGGESRVGDVPLRNPNERVQGEREKVRDSSVSGPSLPSGSPPSAANEVDQLQTDQRDKKAARFGDSESRSNERQMESAQVRPRSAQSGVTPVQAGSPASVLRKGGVYENGKKPAIDPLRSPEESGRQPPKSGSEALWAAVVILALGLVGMTSYACLIIRKSGIGLAQLPGIGQLVSTLRTRMDTTDAKLQELTTNWSSLSQQVVGLNAKMRSSLESARKHSERLIAQAEERMKAEMDQRDRAIDARLAKVESVQQNEDQRLAQFQDQIQKNADSIRQEIAVERESNGRDLNGLRQEVGQNRDDVNKMAQRLDHQRVDFELAKKATQELVPGISLTLTRTDFAYQRFDGYLGLVDDGRILWLSKVSAQRAVPFYPKQGGEPYDLVVTTVSKDGVAGYLLVPKGRSTGPNETASGATTLLDPRQPSGGSF